MSRGATASARAARRNALGLGCLAAAGLSLLAGCATSYDLRQVRSDQKEVRGMVADLQVAVDKLKRQVSTLEAEADQLQGRGRAGSRGSTATLSDLERRIAVVENRLKLVEQSQPAGSVGMPPALPPGEEPPAGAEGLAPLSATPTATPVRAPEISAGGEDAVLAAANVDDTYRQAVTAMRRGKQGEAIPQFREFLRKNPKSDYADDAQFYIGECYYSTKDYNRAILEFNEVLLKYPKGEKVPPALLRQASAFAELGDKVDARLILQKLVGEYPNSEEAARARQMLPQLGE